MLVRIQSWGPVNNAFGRCFYLGGIMFYQKHVLLDKQLRYASPTIWTGLLDSGAGYRLEYVQNRVYLRIDDVSVQVTYKALDPGMLLLGEYYEAFDLAYEQFLRGPA